MILLYMLLYYSLLSIQSRQRRASSPKIRQRTAPAPALACPSLTMTIQPTTHLPASPSNRSMASVARSLRGGQRRFGSFCPSVRLPVCPSVRLQLKISDDHPITITGSQDHRITIHLVAADGWAPALGLRTAGCATEPALRRAFQPSTTPIRRP